MLQASRTPYQSRSYDDFLPDPKLRLVSRTGTLVGCTLQNHTLQSPRTPTSPSVPPEAFAGADAGASSSLLSSLGLRVEAAVSAAVPNLEAMQLSWGVDFKQIW